MVQVSYTRQKEPLGLGHAVLVARDLVAMNVCSFARRRFNPRTESGHQTTHRGLRSYRRRRHRRRRSPQRQNQSLRHRGRRTRSATAFRRTVCCASATWSRNRNQKTRRRIWAFTGRYVCRLRSSIAWLARNRRGKWKFSLPMRCAFSPRSRDCGLTFTKVFLTTRETSSAS